MNGKYSTVNLIYEATVKSQNSEFFYIGSTATTFKLRYTDHKCSFKNRKYRNKSELANHIWCLKDNNETFEIKWKILARATPYNKGSNKWNLCLKEKLLILTTKKDNILNNLDLNIKCRHRFKYKIKNT